VAVERDFLTVKRGMGVMVVEGWLGMYIPNVYKQTVSGSRQKEVYVTKHNHGVPDKQFVQCHP
jgi:hypothetical protein